MSGLLNFLSKLLDQNERELKRLSRVVDAINALEEGIARLSDVELQAKTLEFKQRLENGAELDSLLPEAFAVVREVARRTVGMRHFDVQLMGGIVLHEGKIAEMKTGEGKTLAATLPAYLNALTGHGVHIVTVNDYLAKRDAEWMGKIYRFLGLEVGVVVPGLNREERQQAYAADITYGTNNEFGFDYLRDNMVLSREELVQRELNYAIIDEVDSILIDEARTPLIISGPAGKSTDLYYKFAQIVQHLEEGEDYTVDEKARTVTPTEAGVARVEAMLGVENLYDGENMDLSHYLIQALKASFLMKKDRDYVVKDGQVIIVDEFTGRLMFGRRYSDGLHQAIEAKEKVKIKQETQTLATITFQNYFRMYRKLAGMTGTAATEEEEFSKIYGLDVVVIPTNKPMIRQDLPDQVYRTEAGKFRAVVEEIVSRHREGQPVLVGTISIEKSEMLSRMLKKKGIKHEVLNAKYHEREAEIVAQAGRLGAVTIATNMAGRGTDIMLGGNPEFMALEKMKAEGYSPEVLAAATGHAATKDPEVLEVRERFRQYFAEAKKQTDAEHKKVVGLGGLHIIGTERHESRRIDNQLRGRAGRQGDPGSSRFYVSLEDDLMRLFGSDSIRGLMERLGMEEDQPIEHSMITRGIENAQRKVEARNFELRKNVLEYDDVMNKQREVIYEQRRRILEGDNLKENIFDMMEQVIEGMLDLYAGEKTFPEEWDLRGLMEYAETSFMPAGKYSVSEVEELTREELKDFLNQVARQEYEAKEAELGSETMRELERVIMLRVVDQKWMDHLAAMDDLREGIGLRAYGQRDPLLEYKFEAYEMFQDLVARIREDIIRYIFKVSVVREPERREMHENRPGAAGPAGPVRVTKVGRNDPCPCGSGKKFKKCCGKIA